MAVIWIRYPGSNVEPWLVLTGVIMAAAEMYRRHADKTRRAPMTADKKPTGTGGKGGSAKVGASGIAVGGQGGGGGVPGAGSGGAGGDAEVVGDGLAMGGEGGEAGKAHRGGRGGRGPLEVLGAPNIELPDGRRLWDVGRGGDGASPTTNVDKDAVTKKKTRATDEA